jgi:predicted short-subunit dehydrogenase-like oxidoreductase (DUF2520 family)
MSVEHPARLRVGLIGSGRVGAPISAALRQAGHRITGISAISRESRDRAEVLLPGVPIKEIADVCQDADLLLLTVPDDLISEVAAGLVETGAITAGQLVLHTSGRFGTAVLDCVLTVQALPIAIHPVMTFTGTSVDVQRLQGTPFGVTALEPLLPIAQALVVDIGGEPFIVAEADRPRYHAALAWSSNFLATIVNQGSELISDLGIADANRFIAPLLGATLDNALRYGDSALTGPIARGDVDTVQAHREVFTAHSTSMERAYMAMARLTAERAIAAGLLDLEDAERLLGVLSEKQ